MTEDELKELAKHLLRKTKKSTEAYLKVMVKKILSVKANIYSARDWVEKQKNKQIVIDKLHKCRPDMGLIDKDGNMLKEAWNQSKHDYHITIATMSILLEMPGSQFFMEKRQL